MYAALTAALVILALFLLCAALAMRIKDWSIVDIFWGPAIAAGAIAGTYFQKTPELYGVAVLCTVIWGLRLGTHILLRHRGEDPRYAAWREAWGERANRRALAQVFGLQALLAFLIVLPFWYIAPQVHTSLNLPALIAGIGFFSFGFIWETVADFQLQRFVNTRSSKETFCTSGLWAYCRHPNYFGESMLWLGISLLVFSAGQILWAAAVPAIMVFVLVRFVSGVPISEGRFTKRSGWDEYKAQVPTAFWPRPHTKASK